MATIVIVGVLAESLVNFRGDLIEALVAKGHSVHAFSSPTKPETIKRITSLGAAYHSYEVQRNGLNPIYDMRTLFSLRHMFAELQPDVVLAYTIKPVIWGGLALRILRRRTRFVTLITGAGMALQTGGIQQRILRAMVFFLYSAALKRAHSVIFQNNDDRIFFVKNRITGFGKTYVVDGSGVNLGRFEFRPLGPSSPFVFLTIARLLRAKGLFELARAAAVVKKKYPNVVFRLVGPKDPSPDRIPSEELKNWQNCGLIEYCGASPDVRQHLAEAHVFVLPSYHEGLPRTVLEAMAVGRAILTTDTPGCRETVIENENGFLVPVRNYERLADRMLCLLENVDMCRRMGERSRQLAEDRFDVIRINRKMIEIIEQSGM